MKYNTIEEAARAWVGEFNAIQRGMIAKLMEHEPEDWMEVTTPAKYDRVYVFGECVMGEIKSHNSEAGTYLIETDDGREIEVEADDFEVEHDDILPMWGTMWSFGDPCDDWWIEEGNGIEVLSDCGFRVYQSEEFGYFFGIDGAGYSFYDEHWIPLYKARGLKWHKEEEEAE